MPSTEPAPQRDTRLTWFVSIVSLINVAAIILVWALASSAVDDASAAAKQATVNTHKIAVNQFDACTVLNEAAARSGVTIDSAVEAERRKPVPDQKRIHDLLNFKLPTRDCGAKP